MMQQPLLPLTVKDGAVVPTQSNKCNRYVSAYIVIMAMLIIIVIAILIYFSTQPTVLNGNE
jgi:hypothetical protein